MKLNESEFRQVNSYLKREVRSFPQVLLEKIELGIWVFGSFPFFNLNLTGKIYDEDFRTEGSAFLAGNFGASSNTLVLTAFRENIIPYLMVRVESWECYINCNGKIMSAHCDENMDAVRETCERLRERCGSGIPSVRK